MIVTKQKTPEEYVCVVKVLKRSIAILVKNGQKTPISQLHTDEKTAFRAAERFAFEQNIRINSEVRTYNEPFIGICFQNDCWSPAEFFADRFVVVEKINVNGMNCKFKLDKETAIKVAKTFADKRNLTFINVFIMQ